MQQSTFWTFNSPKYSYSGALISYYGTDTRTQDIIWSSPGGRGSTERICFGPSICRFMGNDFCLELKPPPPIKPEEGQHLAHLYQTTATNSLISVWRRRRRGATAWKPSAADILSLVEWDEKTTRKMPGDGTRPVVPIRVSYSYFGSTYILSPLLYILSSSWNGSKVYYEQQRCCCWCGLMSEEPNQ